MNKNLHRIIFNSTRGQRMVVAETASAGGKAAGGETSGAAAAPGITAHLHPLRFAVLAALGMVLCWQPGLHAQIVAAPGAPTNQRPTVLQTANGLPQVNIQTPSAAGVSRNTYQQFDVQPNGAILNNSRTNVQTQLGGFVGANPWLATGPARVILNEVNSGNPSQLRGYVEVAGQRAEVIIANPAGINVNGGGFLNANRVTLTTGTPVLNGGALEGFRVQGGSVSVGGAGLDTSTADYTAILARAVQLNAGVWARELRVATGANDIDAAHNAAPIAGTGVAPSYAVDVAQLGGMYAGKIYLIGTETGLGVRNAGVIAATGSDLVLQANGWLTNTGSLQAAGNTQLATAGAINNSGTVYAGGNTTLAGQGGISNSGTGIIAAQGNTSLQATGASISAAAGSMIAAGMNSDGTLRSAGDLGVAASGAVALNGQALAGGSVAVSGAQLNLADGKLGGQNISLTASTGNIDASRATLNAQATLSASAAQTLRTDGAAVSAGQLSLTAKDLSNAGGDIVQTGTGDTSIALASPTGTLNNSAGRIATNSQNLTLSAATFNNSSGGKIEHAGAGALAVNATTFNGDGGSIVSTGAASLSATTLSHNNATLLADNLTVAAGTLSNRGGTISQSGLGATSVTATGVIDNSTGKILSNGSTTVSAQSLNNQGGLIQATGASSLGLTTTAALDNSANGQVAAGGAATLNTGTLNNSGGKVTAGGSLTAGAGGAITNVQGLLASNGAASLTAASVDNSRGVMASVQNNAAVTTTGVTVNDSGRIEAAADVTLTNAGLSNTKAAGQSAGGSITGRNITVNTGGQSLNNAFGTIAAAQGATLQTGALNNNAGLVQAGAALGINTNGQALTNTNAAAYAGGAGGITSQGAMTFTTGALNNAAGFIGAKGALTATTAAVSNTAAGQIVGESTLGFTSTAFDNRGGQVQSLGDAGISTGAGVINNTGGLLRSAGTATLTAGSVINSNTLGANQGIEGNNVAITAGAISNDSGAIRTSTNTTLTSGGSLDNTAGLVSAGNTATVQDTAANPAARTLAISNAGGTIVAGRSLAASAASLSGAGSLLSQQDLSLSLSGDFSNTGTLSASGNNTVAVAGTLTNSGKLQAGATLDVTAATIDNTATGEMTGSTTKITATAANTLINRGLIDGVDTQINAVTLNNIGTGRIYGNTLSIAATTLNNDAETVGGVTTAGTIAARQRLDIGASTLNNSNGALIFSAGTGVDALNIGGSLDASRNAAGSAQAVNNAGGTIEALGGLKISAAQINNTNPNFAYTLQGGGAGGGSAREFVTLSGTYSSANGAWSLGPETLTWIPSGGGFFLGVTVGTLLGRGPNGQAMVIPPGSTYSAPIYKTMFNTPDVVPGGTVVVPPAASVWALFGVAMPAGSPPTEAKPQPVCPGTSCGTGDHDDAMWIPPDPAAVAAWEAAAAPWLALQAAMDGARATIASTAIPIEGFRDYTSTTQTAVVTQSTPGRILSSGAMTLNASTALVNDQSQIVAGGALNITGQAVDNRARTISVNAQRTGTAYAWSNFNEGCGGFDGCDYNYNAYRDAPYVQDVPQTTTISIARSQSLLSPASQGLASGTQLASASTASVNAAPGAIGALSAAARSLGIVQVTSIVSTAGALSGTSPVVRTVTPNLSVPTASLFRINPGPAAHYLIETDPRFANYRSWLSSDYMLTALGLDPTVIQKRLGDGFYEQRLVNEQVAQLTGRRFLDGYSNEEAQYQALMNAGATFAQQYQLRPGIALTATQMAALTADIVWLVEQTVTLPDGSKTQALVPQVYARAQAGDIDGAGTLLAGQSTNINLSGDLGNSGTIAGRTIVNLTAENVNNLAGRISGNAVAVTARTDLNNIGGQIDAANSLNVTAGRDLNIASTTSSASNYTEGTTVNHFSLTGIDRVAGLYVTSQTGTTLVASAGRDANIIAGVIANNGATGNTTVTAQRDLNLGTVGTSSSSSVVRGVGTDFLEDRQTADVGSQINTQGNLSLAAGRDLNAKAASVQAAGDLTAVAGNNINITNGQQTNSTSFGLTSNDGDIFSSTSSTERRSGEQSNAVGSSIGGKTITSVAGNDQTVTGSSVIGDAGTTLSAGKNLTIQAATNTSKSSDFKETKEEGLMGSGGAGVTIGSLEQSIDQKTSGTSAAASTVGSITGNVTLVANEAYKQVGSDVMAPGGDVTIVAKKVDIVEARETSRSETEQKFKQSGLTFEVTSPIISAMQTMSQMSEAANNTSDSRMKGLAAANSALAINNVANAVKAGQGTRMNGKDGQIATGGTNPDGTPASRDSTEADKAGGINLAISIGSSSSQSNSLSQSDTARGSTVTAGGSVIIAATGAGQESNLTIQGSTVEAQRAVQLLADNQVNLLAAQNTASQNSTNSSKSGSIGISFGTDGFLVNASASKGKGRADGEDTFYTNTQVKAGQQVSITSGGDTTLQGAVVKAEQAKADVGGNLLIKSLQDSSTYTSSQQSMGGSVSVGFGKMSGSVSASKSNIDSNFNSVGAQSGIKAGDGGFQVNVGGNTTLNGSVIASTDKAVTEGKNSFSTGGTLNISDIQNSASYDAKSVSISVGTSQQPTGKLGMSGLGLGLGSDKANASSTSSAGISGIAGNTAVRSTDAETGLAKIFDADKVQREINAQMQITQAFTREAPKAVASFAASQAAELRSQNNETEAKKWDEGGIYRIALHTVVGALGGGFDGAAGAAASASSANLMNALQDGIQQGLVDAGLGDSAAKALAQTVATLTAAGIGAAVGGTQGAATAATVDANNRQLHQVEKNLIKKLAKGNLALEKQLEQIACADTHCAAGKSDNDPVKAELLADEQYLRSHPQEFAEARKIYDAAKAETQLFGYSGPDQRLDAINANDARSGLYGLTTAELAAKTQATAVCGENKVCSEQVASQYNRTASDRSEFNLAIENLVRSANSCVDLSCSKEALNQLSQYRQDIAYQYHACQDDACRAGTRYAALPLFTAIASLRGRTNDPLFLADAARLLVMGLGENAQNGAALITVPGAVVPSRGNGRGITNGENGASRVFVSNDPIVGKTATTIEQVLPGAVKDVNVPIKNPGIGLSSDADIMLKNGDVIEVKSGGGRGATTQVSNQVKIIGDSGEVIVYGPNLKPSVVKGIESSGTKVFKSLDELLSYIKSKGL